MGLYIYFGVPGSGKTTHAASIVYKNLKKGFPTLSNVEIQGAFLYDPLSDLGFSQIDYCDVILDEAAIEFNNRSYKNLRQETIKWLKKYRHAHVRDIYVYSQAYNDMDVTIRRLVNQMFVVKRILPWLSVIRGVRYEVGPDENHQMNDLYSWAPGFKLLWLPRYWMMFDSWEMEKLPEKDFKCWWHGQLVDVDRFPGSRTLKEKYKHLRADRRRQRLAVFKRLKDMLSPPPPPEPPDPWLQAVLDKTQQEREEA